MGFVFKEVMLFYSKWRKLTAKSGSKKQDNVHNVKVCSFFGFIIKVVFSIIKILDFFHPLFETYL